MSSHYTGEVNIVLAVTGWAGKGFTAHPEPSYLSETRKAGPMSEEQKAERKTLIDNNKAMDSAATVRTGFIKNLLARKTAPKGWQRFLAVAMTHHHAEATDHNHRVAAELAGAKTTEGYDPMREHVAAHTARPEVALLALAIAGFEKHLPRDAWRNPHPVHRFYLNQLTDWGYTASEVEQIITTPDEQTDKD